MKHLEQSFLQLREAVAKYSCQVIELKSQIFKLQQQLQDIHYYSDAHCLYQLEKNYGVKREDIKKVEYSGGHGYTVATVYFNDGTSIIETDETLAGMLLAWFRLKKQYI